MVQGRGGDNLHTCGARAWWRQPAHMVQEHSGDSLQSWSEGVEETTCTSHSELEAETEIRPQG